MNDYKWYWIWWDIEMKLIMLEWGWLDYLNRSKHAKPPHNQQWHMQRAPRRVMRSVNRNSF